MDASLETLVTAAYLSDGTTSVRYESFAALPASFVEQEHDDYVSAVSQVLDPTFAKTSHYDHQDPVAFMKEQMSPHVVEDDGLPVAWDLQVGRVEYRRTLANGDVVVWLHDWVGERRAFDVKSGVARQMRSTDQTPTDEYVLSKTEDGWRIVGKYLGGLRRRHQPRVRTGHAARARVQLHAQ